MAELMMVKFGGFGQQLAILEKIEKSGKVFYVSHKWRANGRAVRAAWEEILKKERARKKGAVKCARTR